jgi:hypothetical protein
MTELMNALEKLHRQFTGRTATLKSVDMLTAEQRRSVLQYLLDKDVIQHPAEDSEILSPHTGLPQKLRGTIHGLTRNYPANLVVDAAMLEMPEEQRAEVARAFLASPQRRWELVDRDTGAVLHIEEGEFFGPRNLVVTSSSGAKKRYQQLAGETEVLVDGTKVTRLFYRSDEAMEQASQDKQKSLRERLEKLKPAPKPEPHFTLLDEDGYELATADSTHEDIRVINQCGSLTNYTLLRVLPEYDARTETKRMVAVYRKVQVP